MTLHDLFKVLSTTAQLFEEYGSGKWQLVVLLRITRVSENQNYFLKKQIVSLVDFTIESKTHQTQKMPLISLYIYGLNKHNQLDTR